MSDLRRELEQLAPSPTSAVDPAAVRALAARQERRRHAVMAGVPVVVVVALVAAVVSLRSGDTQSVRTTQHPGATTTTMAATTTSAGGDSSTTTTSPPTTPTSLPTPPTSPPAVGPTVHAGYTSEPTSQPGEWTATSPSTHVSMLLRTTPYRVNVGDAVMVHLEVTAPAGRITWVSVDTGDGSRLSFFTAASCEAAPSTWSGDRTYTTRQEGVFAVSAEVSFATGCSATDATSAEGISGLVVVRDASAAPGTPYDETSVKRLGCGTANEFGLRGAPLDVMACIYRQSAPLGLDLGLTAYDVDGGVLKRIVVDWGDGSTDDVPVGCNQAGSGGQLFASYGAVTNIYRPHTYAEPGTYPVRVEVQSGGGCGVDAPDQMAVATKTFSIGG